MATRPVVIRLSTENAEKVKAALAGLGADGQRALARIETAGKPASRGLQAVNAAALEADKGLGRVASRAGALANISRAIGPLGVAFGVAAGAATALAFAARRATGEIAAIGDAADRAGVSAETFDQLRAALFQVGQGDKAESLETAIAALNKRIGEARSGVGEAVRLFGALNIQLEDAEGARSFEDVLGDIADRFQDMDAAQRLALGQKLGEEAFRSLVPVLEQGSEGLREMAEAARALGLVYDDGLIRKTQDLNREFELQSEVIRVQLTSALVELSPVLVDIATGLAFIATEAANGYEGLRLLLGLASRNPVIRIGQIGDELTEARARLAELDRDFVAFAEKGLTPAASRLGFDSPDAPINAGTEGGGTSAGPDPDAFNARLAETAAQREQLVLRIEQLNEELVALQGDDVILPPGRTAPSIELGTGTGGGAQASAFQKAIEQVKAQIEQQRLARAAIGLTAGETARLRAETALMAAAQAQFGMVTEQTRIDIHVLAEQLAHQTQTTHDAAEAEKRWEEATKARAEAQAEAARVTTQAIESIGEVMAQVLTGTTDAWRQLLAVALQAVAGSGPLGGLVNQLLNVTGGGLIAAIGGINSVFAPTTSPIPVPRPGGAFGADFRIGGAGGVDSRLLMMPVSPGERVRVDSQPSRREAGSATSVVIHQSWEISGSDEAAVEAALARHRGTFARDAEAAAIRAILRAKQGAKGTLGRML
jgi:hypothetical protein